MRHTRLGPQAQTAIDDEGQGVSTAAAETARTFAANRAVGRIALACAGEGRHDPSCPGARGRLVACTLSGAASAELEAVIVNTAGGVAGGDRFALDVTVEPARGSSSPPPRRKGVPYARSDATIDVRLAVGAMSWLAWLPQETILFNQARLARTSTSTSPRMRGRCWWRRWCSAAPAWAKRWTTPACSIAGACTGAGGLIHAEAMRFDGAVAAKLAQPAIANGGVAIGDRADRACGRGRRGERTWPRRSLPRRGRRLRLEGFAVVRLCAADGAALRHDLVAVLAALRGGSLPRLWLN